MLSRDKRPTAATSSSESPSSTLDPSSIGHHPASTSSTFRPPFIQSRQHASLASNQQSSSGSSGAGIGQPDGGGNGGRWGDVRIVHPAWEGFGRGVAPPASTGGAQMGGGAAGKSKL